MRHVEQFLAHFPNRSVSSLSQKEVEGFSQQVKLKDWQFKQLVIALRILLVDLVSSDAGKSMDWQYWIDAAKQLEDFHPTLAGDHSIKASVAAHSGSSTLNTAQRTLLEELSKCCREKHLPTLSILTLATLGRTLHVTWNGEPFSL